MFSAQTRKDFATRGLVCEHTLTLLSRAKGLDLLKRDEQAEYMVDRVSVSEGKLSALPKVRPELGEYLSYGDGELLHYRLDQINYPVPGYAGYDAS